MSILARDPVTGALTLIDSALPRDVALDLGAGAYEVLPVGDVIGSVNVLDVAFATAPLVSGSATAGATLTVSGTATSAVAYEYQWLADGVLIPGATTDTYATDATADLGKTFTGQMRAQDARGRWTAYVASSNSITIPAPAVYSIPDGEWTAVEDPDDAETRQTYVTATPTVPVPTGKKLRWYKGPTNPTDSSMFVFLSDMAGTGPYTADGVSTVAVGTVVYSRLAISNLDNTGQEWVTSIKNYTTSNVPSAPGAFTATNSTTVTGRVSLDPNNTAPAANGRPIIEYGYSQNGGAITAFATGGAATTARDVDFAGIDPITVRIHARNVNGWSVGSAPQTVTPPVVVSGVNTTAPTLESSFYGGAWYTGYDGTWTGSPSLTYDLEQSDDGSTGWTSTTAAWVTGTAYTVGMRRTNGGSTYVCLVAHTSGTFATDLTAAKWELATATTPQTGYLPQGQLDGKYVRLKVIPSLGSAAYSAASLVRSSYSHVLRFNPVTTAVAANIDRTVSMPLLGYELTTGGIWMQAFVYFDGTSTIANYLMGLGNIGSGTSHMSLNGNGMFVVSGSGYSAQLPSVADAQPRWYLCTGYVWKVGGTVFFNFRRNEVTSDTGSQALALTLATSGYTALRIGNRANNTTSLATKARAVAFSVGTGDPSAFHDWVLNDGDFRNPLDYNFGTDPLGATMGFHERGYRVGAATWTTADGVDEIGTLDTVTNTGGSTPTWDAPTAVLPPFINAFGPAPAVPDAFISPEFVFAGTPQSFQVNAGISKIVEGSLTASPWVTDTSYALGARVTQSGNTYICSIAHTSGTFATDLTAVRWKIYTITSLTHTGWPVGSLHCPEGSTGLGNITGTITNGIFTCSTPGTLSAAVVIGGVSSTLTGAIYPAVAMPATPRDASLFNGNGLVAAFEPYPTIGAGTTYASAALLGTAIGAMTAGTTLVVENLSDASNVLTIPARDYGGAVVVARNLHGVDVASITCQGVRNLTIRGFECVGPIGNNSGGSAASLGVDGFWIDHCKADSLKLRSYSATAGVLRVTNFQTPETGVASGTQIYSFQTVIILRSAWGDTSSSIGNDTVRLNGVERQIVRRVFVGDNYNVEPGAHPDCWQVYGVGPNGYGSGVYEDVIVIDQVNGEGAQGLFLQTVTKWRGLLMNRCAVSASMTNNIIVEGGLWNVVMQNCSSSANTKISVGLANSAFAKNVVRGSAGPVLDLATAGTELGTLSISDSGLSVSAVWPQWNTYPLSWRKWANPAVGYTTNGAFEFIAELEAKRVALGI